jgi:hypothetical protein
MSIKDEINFPIVSYPFVYLSRLLLSTASVIFNNKKLSISDRRRLSFQNTWYQFQRLLRKELRAIYISSKKKIGSC